MYFVKRHCRWLAASGPEVLGSAGLHTAWFGAHILPEQLRTLAPYYEFGAVSASAQAANPPNTQDSGARPPADQQVPPSRPEAVVEQRGNEAGEPEAARQQTLPQGDTRQDSGTSGRVALDVSIEWTLLREERRQRRFQSQDAFREALEKCLGEAKDPGIYKVHDESTEKQDKLFAHCRETACANCTRKVKTAFSGDLFCVWVKGQHGQLQPPQGGRLWTSVEMYAIEAAVGKNVVTVDLVRQGLRAAGLPLRCTKGQLYNNVTRQRQSQQAAKPRLAKITVADLAAAAGPYMVPATHWEADAPWRNVPLDQLIVLPEAINEC